jgi:hypothetical protein
MANKDIWSFSFEREEHDDVIDVLLHIANVSPNRSWREAAKKAAAVLEKLHEENRRS